MKQLLLLILRIIAVAIAVAMLAQLVTPDQWSTVFGGGTTHHVMLLDDSYSMSDHSGKVEVFNRAAQVIAMIGARASADTAQHKLTLIRFSRAMMASQSNNQHTLSTVEPVATENREQADLSIAQGISQLADISSVTIGDQFDVLFEEKRRGLKVSEFAVGPEPALEIATKLVGAVKDESHVVYVISDFRHRNWGNPQDLLMPLRRLEQAGADIRLISCAYQQRSNLAITDLRPAAGTRAAGVPLFFQVTVKNFGPQTATQVPLKIRTRYYDPAELGNDPSAPTGKVDDLPIEMIESIEAGNSVSRQIQTFFPRSGQHVVEAMLPDDAINLDNQRYAVVDVPESVPVLVIDGDTKGRNAFFLESVFQPGEPVRTGIHVDVQDETFLRDTTGEKLAEYRSVYLLDVPRLGERATELLNSYLRDGGGVGVFFGENSDLSHYRRWFDDGVFPVPTDRVVSFTFEDPATPDLQVSEHPLFKIFTSQKNPYMGNISIDQHVVVPNEWSPDVQSGISVLARMANGEPLIVERRIGNGRITSFLTTLAPIWNNWAQNPSFVVFLLDLQSYLTSSMRTEALHEVGTPVRIEHDNKIYRDAVSFVVPGEDSEVRQVIEKRIQNLNDKEEELKADNGITDLQIGHSSETARSGIYECWRFTHGHEIDVRRYALNVNTTEGDLRIAHIQELFDKLHPIKFQFHRADELSFEKTNKAGFNWSEYLLYALIALLLLEQVFAYSSSYHPKTGGVS